MGFQIKRIYDEALESDGARVLVDRLWPRGVSKERAALTDWMKDVAPSEELREWFGHKPGRFGEFRRDYVAELKADAQKQAEVEKLRHLSQKGTVTLLYAAKDREHNQAVVLKEYLEKQP